ncbi:MAG TPA: sulfite oxidase [Candidatus Limnocylindria bacterium]|jgi:sulfite oxidase|nr:sulfite oxidase [Candidatus Limnocylindria bacterium]
MENSLSRSRLLAALGGALGAAALPLSARAASAPLMDVIVERPYDWGTPLAELDGLDGLYTSNRAFFIRSHMGPPPSIDRAAWRLTIDGMVERPLQLSLDDLRKMEHVDVPAVLQCSGNGRFFYGTAFPTASHPAGAQWQYGGVGHARWTGVRMRDLLHRAGVKSGARYSNNYGLDNPLLPTTPKFIRGLELEKLLDPGSILAYEMNGEPLPYYHGFPVRLIVPGWAGDHWVKWITHMTIADAITTDFWTSAGYRYPNKLGTPGKGVKPTDEHPVTTLNVKSLILSPLDGARPRAGTATVVRGVAWSGDGAVVRRVEVSVDGGRSWRDADLGESPGRFGWRTFSHRWTPQAGTATIMARATDDRGAVQPRVSPWNPGGYLWNAIQSVQVEAAHA